MNINLRFGMQRDIPVIHAEQHKIDGLVIPAHILAFQGAPTSVFVASISELDYIVDPMTFILQHPRSSNANDAGDLRISVRRMCEAYHGDLFRLVDALGRDETMTPDGFPPIRDFCEGVISFQENAVQRNSTTSKAAKYIGRYGEQRHTAPRLLLTPYFKFESVGDEWYRFSLRCARETQKIRPSNHLGVVVCCSSNSLNNQSIRRIATDYSGFGHFIIWLVDFDEMSVSRRDIAEARRLVTTLAETGATVESLYGGYLLMLMGAEGLVGISHGILYTQHKGFAVLPGGGGPSERYYIPKLRAFRSLSQTDLILHQSRDLMCTCEVCAEVMEGNPDRLILFGDEPELLRRHFITVRHLEANGVTTTDRAEEIGHLRETYRAYNDSIQRLPNPDAFISRSRMRGLDYLNTWADGLEERL